MGQSSYPLGTTDQELVRLGFQHEVWAPVTRAFLARCGLRPGLRVLDLGAGPGFVTFDLAAAVGPAGRVVALDESPRWREVLERGCAANAARNVELVTARIEEARFERGSFDLIVSRWVFSFLQDPAAVARRAAEWLAPGGVLAIEDYNHEGISLFPESAGFRAVVRATRELYTRSGGSLFVMGRALELLAGAGLRPIDLRPNVLCGAPGSDVWRWADLFFPHFAAVMRAQGLLTADELALFQREWRERSADPQALFFSPILLDAAGRSAPG
jgi:SAM-dependent methyltransferase